jgi:hypothetical protein
MMMLMMLMRVMMLIRDIAQAFMNVAQHAPGTDSDQ